MFTQVDKGEYSLLHIFRSLVFCIMELQVSFYLNLTFGTHLAPDLALHTRFVWVLHHGLQLRFLFLLILAWLNTKMMWPHPVNLDKGMIFSMMEPNHQDKTVNIMELLESVIFPSLWGVIVSCYVSRVNPALWDATVTSVDLF